ncbi:hypothetical protein CKA32_001569 [Geitlerinema sp. FC II]|nr:hypothetical protein CKA32_001569 [Geitlerinema sp. FC II]
MNCFRGKLRPQPGHGFRSDSLSHSVAIDIRHDRYQAYTNSSFARSLYIYFDRSENLH